MSAELTKLRENAPAKLAKGTCKCGSPTEVDVYIQIRDRGPGRKGKNLRTVSKAMCAACAVAAVDALYAKGSR